MIQTLKTSCVRIARAGLQLAHEGDVVNGQKLVKMAAAMTQGVSADECVQTLYHPAEQEKVASFLVKVAEGKDRTWAGFASDVATNPMTIGGAGGAALGAGIGGLLGARKKKALLYALLGGGIGGGLGVGGGAAYNNWDTLKGYIPTFGFGGGGGAAPAPAAGSLR